MVVLDVTPERSLVDTPLRIRLTGLQAQQRVGLRSSQTDDSGRRWRAQAEFEADDGGSIDVTAQAPTQGSYTTADAMGLVWSMRLDADEPDQSPFFGNVLTPVILELTAEINGATVAQRSVERLYVADGV